MFKVNILIFFVSVFVKESSAFKIQVSTDNDKTAQCFPIRTTNPHARQFFFQIGQTVRSQQLSMSSFRGISSSNVNQLVIDVASCACAKTPQVKVNELKQLVLLQSVMRNRSQRKLGRVLANNVDACRDFRRNRDEWKKMF